MAEVTRPQDIRFSGARQQAYNVTPAHLEYQGPDGDAGDNLSKTADIFSTFIKGLTQSTEIIAKSEQTANRLQAQDLIVNKMKHHGNLLRLLSTELNNTPPEHLSLKDVLSKLDTRDGQGRTELNIGQNLDVNISPLLLDESLPDEVKTLIEEGWIRMDQELLSKVLSGVEKAQSNYDTSYLTFELNDYRQKVKTAFMNAETTEQAKEATGILLGNMFNRIQTRSDQGGTLDEYEIDTWNKKAVQSLLEEWYIRELRDENVSRDQVIERAEEGYYSIQIGETRHALNTNFYNAHVLKRSDRDEAKRIKKKDEEKENTKNRLIASYERKYSGNNFKGYEDAVKDLQKLGAKGYEAIRWATQQEVDLRGGKITDIENKIFDQSEFDKEFLLKFTNKGKKKDKYGRTKIVAKRGKDLEKAVREAFSDVSEDDAKYVTEAFITRLITAHERETKQEAIKELTTRQKAGLSSLDTDAGQDYGSARIIKRFYSKNHDGEWEINSNSVQNDMELALLFGSDEKFLNQKLEALGPIGRKAISHLKNFLNKLEGAKIGGDEHERNITSIAQEYNQNLDSALELASRESTLRPQYADDFDEVVKEEASDQLGDQWVTTRNSLQGKKPTADQLLDYWHFENQLDSMLKIGQNVVTMDTTDLASALVVLNGPGNEYGTNARIKPLKDKITTFIKARQDELARYPALLAIKETKQLGKLESGQQLDVDKILEWQADYKAGNREKLLPTFVLEKVKSLTNAEMSQEERLAIYTGLYAKAKQFGNDDQQRVALGQLRNYMKQNANPALAGLTDLWDDLQGEAHADEIFKAASNIFPHTATDAPGTSKTSEATMAEINQANLDRGKTIGMKSTMADPSQRSDLIALERAVIRSRASAGYYDGMNKDDISDHLAKQLHPYSFVVDTGQRYNFEVDTRAYEAIGLNAEDDADRGYKFYMQEFERSGTGEWSLIPNIPEGTLEQLRDQAIDSAMLVDTPQGSHRYREGGRFYEEDAQGNKKEIFNDYWSQLQEETMEKILGDIITGNSKNLKKGFINSKDGFNIGVYLLPPSGNENQAVLLGTFLEKDQTGKKVPKFVSQQDLATASASSYVLDFIMGAKFALLFDRGGHDYVRTLQKEGKERLRKDTMGDRISSWPFFRFLDSPGKLEFNHAILPLLEMLDEEASRQGVDTLSQPHALLILKKFTAQQDRWYKSDWMPDIMEPFFEKFSNFPFHGLPQGKIDE